MKINNNNLHNKFIYLTDVSFELGKQIVNIYNYYLLNSNKEIQFSLFIFNNPTKIIKYDDLIKLVILG